MPDSVLKFFPFPINLNFTNEKSKIYQSYVVIVKEKEKGGNYRFVQKHFQNFLYW